MLLNPAAPSSIPSISVVTICRNAARGIERTLRSVAEQDYAAIEYVVVDGGSSDGTLAAIQRYRDHIRHFTSEPDRGISHAFNKGIAASTGDWVLLLNAGDAFIGSDALRRLAGGIEKSGDAAARIVSARSRCGRKSIPRYRIRDGLGLILRAHLSHQATLIHRNVYAEHGGYDESFNIRMDFDFFLRVLPREHVTFLDQHLVEFEPGGVSGREFLRHWSEGRKALAKNRCGPLARIEFEAIFLLMAGERLVSS